MLRWKRHITKIDKDRHICYTEQKIGEDVLYVNGKYRGDDEVGKLMHDFSCTDPDDMNYEILEKKQDILSRTRKKWLLCVS